MRYFDYKDTKCKSEIFCLSIFMIIFCFSFFLSLIGTKYLSNGDQYKGEFKEDCFSGYGMIEANR
jgi:hypothetical protein